MSRAEIDAYLAALDEPKRKALEHLRRTILHIVPEAEECISYRMPAFRVGGHVIAGFAAAKNHLSYYPFSGSVLAAVPGAAKYAGTKSALHFKTDAPLPDALVKQLLEVRLREARSRS